jgi:sedoheptulose-bisphosphatase
MEVLTKEQKTKQYSEYAASSTSFYTTTEKKDYYESLENILEAHCEDEKIRIVITDMLNACAEITEALRTTLVTVEGSVNEFGDTQLSVDVSLSCFLPARSAIETQLLCRLTP